MTGRVALLRGVNVGGNHKLPMERLKAIGEEAGFANVRTYIASGNLVFASGASEAECRERVEGLIEQEFGKKLGVLVRSAAELAQVAKANPFADCPGNRVVAIFADGPLSLDGVKGQAGERIELGERVVYVHYPDGQADTKLVIPAAKNGTARNMNTVAKLAELAREAGNSG
jgi:uncharacterized protein (DUF1697 family)